MAKRAFSIVELLVVISLSAMVIGATVTLYGYTVNRLAIATSRFAALDQVRKLHGDIEDVVRDSVSTSTVASVSGTALKCILAANSQRASSSPSLKKSQLAPPVSVAKRGYERFGSGTRVWFYFAGTSGTFNTVGTTLFRAERSDDSPPTATDVVAAWRFHPGTTTPRFDLITTLTFSVNTTTRTVSTTIAARALWRDERSGLASDKSSQTFTEMRTTGWRHWLR